MNKGFRFLLVGIVASLLCASSVKAAELKLAGVTLGSPVSKVLVKYGNPQEIRVSGSAAATPTAARGGTGSGAAGGPARMAGGPVGMGGGPARMGGGPARMGGGPARMGGRPGMAGTANTQQAAVTGSTGQEVTYVYRFSNGRSLELLINDDGIVVQIAAYGTTWAGVSTTRGIHLGSTYKDILLKYGFPESHESQGVQLLTRYQSKHRVVFTTIGRSVVAITIAL